MTTVITKSRLIRTRIFLSEYFKKFYQHPFRGEHNQVQYLDVLFGDKKAGFFVEAGAFDGELYSNTLYLEMKKSWSGILVPILPTILYFRKLDRLTTIFLSNWPRFRYRDFFPMTIFSMVIFPMDTFPTDKFPITKQKIHFFRQA